VTLKSFDFSYFDGLIDSGLEHAVFDLENTIVRSDVTQLYFYIKKNRASSRNRYLCWKYFMLATCGPIYLGLDFLKREWFQRAFFRRFEEFSPGELDQFASQHHREVLQDRFIPYVHDLIFHLKSRGVDVRLLSTSTEPIVGRFAEYFSVPHHCLGMEKTPGGCRVDLSGLRDFKLNYIRRFDPAVTMATADSRHDLPVLEYVSYPVVVGTRRQRWMRRLEGKLIIDGTLVDL